MSGMNETLNAIAETLRALLARECDPDTIKAADGGTWSADLWRALDEAGVLLATVPEAAGGLGLGLDAATLIARVAASYAAPVPIAETLLAHWLWHQGGGITATPPSAERLTLCVAEGNAAIARAMADVGPLAGTLPRVPWARHADTLLIVTPAGDSALLARVPMKGAKITHRVNLADEPRDDVELTNVALSPAARRHIAIDADRVSSFLALMRAAQLVGAMEAAIAITVQYANDRVQFGRPIGKFQAIQSHIAGATELVAAAGVALEQAAASADDPRRAPLIWTAKALASESANHVATAAHQVHGAIGFTREYRLQLLTRRLWSWREECGNEDVWYARLGEKVLGGGADNLWPWLTSLSPSAGEGETATADS